MREEEEGGGRVSLEVVVDPRRRDAVRGAHKRNVAIMGALPSP